jgi:hypothetical protein
MTYLARSSFLLQQGKPVADLLYLINEGAPSTMPFWGAGLQPAPPPGFDYDYTNADALLTRVSVSSDGSLVLPDGVRYRVLVLPQTDRMTLTVLRKVAELVRGGATVVGPRPARSPSLVGGAAAEAEHAALAEEVWGDLDGIDRTRRSSGAGTVVWGRSLAVVLAQAGVMPDVEFAPPLDGEIAWIHRRTADAEIYYVTSSADRPIELDVRFRAGQREPEIWRPESGRIERASYAIDSTRTRVYLPMTEHDAFFVVFRRGAETASRVLPAVMRTTLTTVGGPWRVAFAPDLGAPPSIVMPQLASWTMSADSGVKYFSGTATYTHTVRTPASWRGRRIMLSLGDVRDMAEVTVNGVTLPLLWKAPFETDVTGALRPGANEIAIRVTNEWTNRIIGDRASAPDKRVLAQGGPPPFGARPQVPSPSGLLGPVRFIALDDAR